MAAWDLTTPSDDALAATIHTIIQESKIDIMERMRSTNAFAVDEHIVFDTTATGKHDSSRVGFVRIHATDAAFMTATTNVDIGDGCLHFVDATDSLYVKSGTEFLLTTSLSHGQLSGLDDDDHTQYLLVDGSRAMGGDITIVLGGEITVTTFSTSDDTSPIIDTHIALSWFDAHGADALATTHFTDASVPAARVTTTRIGEVNRIPVGQYDFVPPLGTDDGGNWVVLSYDGSAYLKGFSGSIQGITYNLFATSLGDGVGSS